MIHRISENNFNIVLVKVILSSEPHYFPVYVSFPGVLPNDKQTQACSRFGVFCTNRVAGVCFKAPVDFRDYGAAGVRPSGDDGEKMDLLCCLFHHPDSFCQG